jgi:hypothetical protein
MEMKAEWLAARKLQIIAELTECETQSKEVIGSLITENTAKGKEIAAL